jgi:hypothetical protein
MPAAFRRVRSTLPLLSALLAGAAGAEGLCPEWSDPETIGTLDVGRLPEASGLAISRDGGSLFLINDGARPEFLVGDGDGSALRTVTVRGFAPRDIEDLALGRCDVGTCLFLADIGDNARRRGSVQIVSIAAGSEFGATVDAHRLTVARYPDGPHDAEAIGIDAAGDLWLVTKSPFGRQLPAQVFGLTASQLAGGGDQAFETRGEIPFAVLGGTIPSPRQVVTAMDFAPDGRRFALLTYDSAVEFVFEPGQGIPAGDDWQAGRTHRPIVIAPLLQAESIAYADGGRSLVYTTESIRGSPAPLYRQSCR